MREGKNESGKARLLICIGEYVAGAGQSAVVRSELDALSDKYDTILVAPLVTAEVPAGVRVERISMLSLRGVLRLRRLVRCADVVHLHDSLGYMAVAIGTDRTKCLVTCHGIAPPAMRRGLWQQLKGYVTLLVYPWLYRRAVTVVTISEYLGRWLSERGVHNHVIIPNGAPDEVVVPAGLPSGSRLVYIGEVSPRKGLDLLIEGIAASPSDVTLDVVGSGDLRWVSELVAGCGLDGRVTVHGYLPDVAMVALLDTALAVVSLSRWEGFGLPVVEGFARGRPAIVLGGSAMAEVVARASAGVIVDGPSALPAAVRRVREQWGVLSQAAITAAKRHRWTDAWASYERLFQGMIDADRPNRPPRDPTILIDCDVLRAYPGGIRRVTEQLETSLRRARPCWVIHSIPRSVSALRDQRSWHVGRGGGVLCQCCKLMKLVIAYTIWPQVVVPLKAILNHTNIIICPNYVFPLTRVKQCVVIVNDTSPFSATRANTPRLRSLSVFFESTYYWIIRHYICFALAHAKGIIVPSHKVHRLILQMAPKVAAPVFVIPWGVSNHLTDPPAGCDVDINATAPPYLLCVNPHNDDSITYIVRALNIYHQRARGAARPITLKVVGHYSDLKVLPAVAEYLGRVSDRELSRLYREALATVIGSVNSGFGLPLLEALGSGCPCIVMSGTAEAEVAAGHGVYEVPDDVGAWVDAIEDLVYNPPRRKRLALDGYCWAKTFTWERVGVELAEVIETLLQCD